jgi:2-C-methyl-D-erythritol 4-phosphate cytidylyltransferase
MLFFCRLSYSLMTDIKKYAVIVAGGQGLRMGAAVPKQFLPIHGMPLLCYPVRAFAAAIPGINIVLVLPADQLHSAQTVLRTYISDINVTTVAGGETRYHSVQNGLKMIHDDGVVFVHDGVRPLISSELIQRCYHSALERGNAIPCVAVTDSIRMLRDDDTTPIDRDLLRIIQTPQTFKTSVILPAFKQEYKSEFTDEATVAENFGIQINLVEGLRENIKVTTPTDITIVEAMLKSNPYSKL